MKFNIASPHIANLSVELLSEPNSENLSTIKFKEGIFSTAKLKKDDADTGYNNQSSNKF